MARSKQGFGEEVAVEESAASGLSTEELNVQTFQLADLSRRLPVGFFVGGTRLQNFELHPYTTEHDLLLSQRGNDELQVKVGRFLSKIVKSIEGYEVDELAKEMSCSPQKLFERAYLADVLMMILAVRSETVGDDIAVVDQCRRCSSEIKDTADTGYHDLSECDVSVALNLNQKPIFEVMLQDGYVEFGSRVQRVLMQPMRLYQLKDTKGTAEDKMDIAMMYNMICGLPDVAEYNGVTSKLFTDTQYRQLTLRDRDILLGFAKKLIKLGPEMVFEVQCDSCRFKQPSYVPWFQLRQFCSEPASASE